jgi:hypothetical protein
VVALLVAILLTINFAMTLGGATVAGICFLVACAIAVSLIWTMTRWAAERRRMARSAHA